jgi:hypothetical protein
MRIKAIGHPLPAVPALAGTVAHAIEPGTRAQESTQRELSALASRPPSTAQAARPLNRATLSKLLAATPHSCADTAVRHPEAARVMGRVAGGELALRNRYEPAKLRAATTLAAGGLAMLRRLHASG